MLMNHVIHVIHVINSFWQSDMEHMMWYDNDRNAPYAAAARGNFTINIDKPEAES